MNTMTILLNANIESIIARKRDEYASYLKRIENAYKEENSMLSPNLDCNGRLHSPCDGYKLPQFRLDICDYDAQYEEQIFAKGAFLPNPIREDNDLFYFVHSAKKTNFKHHLKVFLSGEEIIDAMKAIDAEDKPVEISFGREWLKKEERNCYMYVKSAFKTINNKIKAVVDGYMEERTLGIKAAEEAAKALKGDAPEGRVTVVATVSGLPIKEDYYQGYVTKLMLTLENGATAYGSLPAKISNVKVGDLVEITATFEVAKDDKTHSFFKRPSKPSIKEILQ